MTVDEEVWRATKLIEAVMQARGFNRKELDKKMGTGAGYASQVLTGRMELKLRHILAILRALDVEPSVFFSTLYPENPEAERNTLGEFLKRFSGFGPADDARSPQLPPAAVLGPAELEHLVHSAVQMALSERSQAAVSV